MKKILMSLSSALVVALMAGCGGGSGDENKSAEVDESCASSLTPMACQYRNTMAVFGQDSLDYWVQKGVRMVQYQGGYLTDAYNQTSFDELMSAQDFEADNDTYTSVVTDERYYYPNYDGTAKGIVGAVTMFGGFLDAYALRFIIATDGYAEPSLFDDVFGLKVASEKLAAVGATFIYDDSIGDLSALSQEYISGLVSSGVFKEEQCSAAQVGEYDTYYVCGTVDFESGAIRMVQSQFDNDGKSGVTAVSVCTDIRAAPIAEGMCGTATAFLGR
jgi:hypothetical protein